MPRRNRRDPESLAAPLERPRRSDPPSWAFAPGYDVRQVTGDKDYRCPGCDHLVRAGTWHLVIVPKDDVEARRHWHSECWRRELRRLGR
jgi:hypothetical protein